MHKGSFSGLHKGSVPGLVVGRRKGNVRGLVTNDRAHTKPFVIGSIGDSTADGAALSIKSCPTRTLYNYRYSGWEEITTQSVANDSISSPGLTKYGSIWQHFANFYKAEFNRPVYLVNGAKGGSSYFTSTFSWYTTGTLWTEFVAKMVSALSTLGKKEPDLLVLKLGINDVRAGFSFANITTGIDSLFTRITTAFPNTPVLVVQLGRTETDVTSLDLTNVREYLIDKCNNNANFYMVGSPPALALTGGYEADGLHENSTGQAVLAKNFVNWLTNSRFSKWGRSVISTLYDVPDLRRKILIDDLVSSQVANGNYFIMDGWHVWKTSTLNNMHFDFSFMGFAAIRTATFNANDSVAFSGSTYSDLAYTSGYFIQRSSQNDIIMGAKVKTRTNTTASYLFGNFDGADGSGVLQFTSPTPVAGRVNESTTVSGTDVLLQAGNMYSVARNGTTRDFIKNATTQGSAASASIGTQIFPISVGCFNNAGTRGTFTTGSVEYVYVARYSSFNLSSFYNAMETFVAAW